MQCKTSPVCQKQPGKDRVECSVRPVLSARPNVPHPPTTLQGLGEIVSGRLQVMDRWELAELFKWSLVIVQVMRTEVCLVDADVVYVLFFFIVTVHVMTCVDMINI